MRLDLFLKISRLVKRRSVARELCESGGVLVNGHVAKPAKEIRQGDMITLLFSTRILKIEITDASPPGKRGAPEALYLVKSDRRVEKEPLA